MGTDSMDSALESTEPTFFDENVQLMLKKYVYRLIDPRCGETFYVGKGTGNRVFEHARGELIFDTDALDNPLPSKLDRINEIKKAGLQVQYVIHRHGLDDNMAFIVESILIDAYPALTNVVRGHGADDFGMMTAKEIVIKYGLPELELNPPHKLVLININKLKERDNRDEIYRLVRYCWRINKDRVEKADYVLAVVRGVVLGAFEAEQWLPATPENFRTNDKYDIEYADGSEAHRWGFKGKPAPAEIWVRYVGTNGKRIVQRELRHDQYPIRYWGC